MCYKLSMQQAGLNMGQFWPGRGRPQIRRLVVQSSKVSLRKILSPRLPLTAVPPECNRSAAFINCMNVLIRDCGL